MKAKIILTVLFFSSFRLSAQTIENPSFDSAYIGGIDRIHAWITSDAWYNWSMDTVAPMTANTHYTSSGLQYHELLQTAQLEYANAFHGSLAIKLFSVPGKVHVDGNPYKGFVTNGNHFYTDGDGYIDFKKGGTPFTDRPIKLRGHFKFDNTSASLTNFGKAVVLLKKYNSALQQIDTVAYAEGVQQFISTSSWTSFELPLTYYSNQAPDSVVVVFQSSASGLSSTFIVDSLGFYYAPTGMSEDANNNEIVPYRYDDVQELIYFTANEKPKTVKLLDLNGKLVKQQVADQSPMTLSELAKGIYFLEIELNSAKQVYKILK